MNLDLVMSRIRNKYYRHVSFFDVGIGERGCAHSCSLHAFCRQIESLVHDVTLIKDNCRTYNEEGEPKHTPP
jgi:hypothetical protein